MNTFDGTEEEFARLINTHKASVYGTAYAYFSYNAEIDDVVQETFVNAYLNYGTIKDKSKIGAWLCGVARNISLKKHRNTRCFLTLKEIEDIGCGDVESEYIKDETHSEIHQAIAALSKPVAETISLFYIAGKSVREISALLSVPEGTVKSRLHDGRKQLKGELINMMKQEFGSVVNENTAKNVQELIDKAKSENQRGQLSIALTHLDEAIALLRPEPKSNKNYRLLSELYKIRSISHGAGYNENAMSDGVQSVAYAKLTGSKRLIAESLLSHAFDDVDGCEAVFMEAYQVADGIDYHEVCAECAFWLGAKAIQKEHYDKANTYLLDALERYSNIGSNASANCCIGDSIRIHALASAALKSIEMLREQKHLNGEYISLNSFCQMIRISQDTVITDNSYGWAIPGRQKQPDHYYRFSGHFQAMGLLCSQRLLKMGKEDFEYYTADGVLVNMHYEVLSNEENITVAANTFRDCFHIKVTEAIPGYESDNIEHKSVFNDLTVSEYWFAPDIGLIRAKISYPNKSHLERFLYELTNYEIVASADPVQKYLPLHVGNRWEYCIFDEEGKPYSEKYSYRDCYEVDTIINNIAYIANSGYAFLK